MSSWAKDCVRPASAQPGTVPGPAWGRGPWQWSQARATLLAPFRSTQNWGRAGAASPLTDAPAALFHSSKDAEDNVGLESTSWNHSSNECCIINAAAKLMWFLLDNTAVYPLSQSSEEALQVPSPIQSKEPDLL